LFEREFARDDDLIRVLLIMHRYDNGAYTAAHRDLHVGKPLRPGTDRSGFEALGLQYNLRVVLRVEQRITEHVPTRSVLCGIRNIRWEVRFVFLRPKRCFIDGKLRDRQIHLERRVGEISRNIKGTVERMRGDDMIVSGLRERASPKYQNSQQ